MQSQGRSRKRASRLHCEKVTRQQGWSRTGSGSLVSAVLFTINGPFSNWARHLTGVAPFFVPAAQPFQKFSPEPRRGNTAWRSVKARFDERDIS